MTSVSKLLEQKEPLQIWTVAPDDTVFEAIKLMDSKRVGALVVVVEQGVAGIISERDYARKVILKDRSSKDTQVKEIMTRHVFHTRPEQDIEECLAVMTQHHIRHLPVMHNNKLLGMISIGDVVKEIISDQKFKIENLEHTISWEESY